MLEFLANKLADKNKKPGLKQKPAVFVEFIEGHWAVQVRNPGQDRWTYVIDFTKKVNVYNNFGDLMGTRPVIQSFDSYDQAVSWVQANITGATFEKLGARDAAEAYSRSTNNSTVFSA